MNMKIVTKEVTRKGEHLGWKVYIDGEKFPKKPKDFYDFSHEETAIKFALQEAGVAKVIE